MTATEYNYPLTIPGGYFIRATGIPLYADYRNTYYTDFIRYLYYMCVMNAEEEYPIHLSLEKMEEDLKDNKDCKKKINKILIGEAPPPTYANYFYNIRSPWNSKTRTPGENQSWTSAIKNALFPGMGFPDKITFLQECAKKGFLLIDLFPYAISYKGRRSSKKYNEACVSAFGGGISPYPFNTIAFLDSIKCCIKDEFAIGFAMKSSGNIILEDISIHRRSAFHTWLSGSGKRLTPSTTIEELRRVPRPSASKYLRVCGIQGPTATLLNDAGIV